MVPYRIHVVIVTGLTGSSSAVDPTATFGLKWHRDQSINSFRGQMGRSFCVRHSNDAIKCGRRRSPRPWLLPLPLLTLPRSRLRPRPIPEDSDDDDDGAFRSGRDDAGGGGREGRGGDRLRLRPVFRPLALPREARSRRPPLDRARPKPRPRPRSAGRSRGSQRPQVHRVR